MKRTYQYNVNEKVIEKEYTYIPFRYIKAIFLTLAEVLAVIGIVIAFCYYVPYFYIAACITSLGCILKIISSDDNPDYKVPWILFVFLVPIAGFMFYSRKLQKKYINTIVNILPHIPDKKLVFGMTRSFYPRLMSAGVKIYEYEPGFIHAKSYVADGKSAMIGTINLDYRSLVHHFENGVWMYKTSSIKDMIEDIEETMKKSIEIKPDMLKTDMLTRTVRAVVRIFAPML